MKSIVGGSPREKPSAINTIAGGFLHFMNRVGGVISRIVDDTFPRSGIL
jgi:hypothetical protein